MKKVSYASLHYAKTEILFHQMQTGLHRINGLVGTIKNVKWTPHTATHNIFPIKILFIVLNLIMILCIHVIEVFANLHAKMKD